ncbi:Zinc finger MYM-type protein 1-like protein [Heracleum sosnowskyi]|uniref:Zinc finger MYM-type protein 1-like protein n=1 Tax=Heracleum sosnowskyi TaxID=360622 RepID=A0AAD8MLC1_9APIA|nr:Zinc finger MYM-type protein 1-like protein [Heracleum sosnowskyi]
MERFYKRKVELVIPAEEQVPSAKKTKADNQEVKDRNFASTKNSDMPINLADLEADPGLRILISDYNVNDRDEVRRRYLLKGNVRERDCFVRTGYSNWKERDIFGTHAGKPDSAHSHALKKCNALLNQKQHIATFFTKQSKKDQVEYRVRLESSVDSIRFLLRQGLPFCGHDESSYSSNQGNFLELLKFMGCLNKDIKYVTLQNALENGKLISPDIQKDIANAAAIETINVIIKDIGDSLFSVLVDESRDISMKEQMAVVVRYVDKRGCVIERFLGLEHVPSTTVIALKAAIDKIVSRYKLSITSLRGQGYDRESNMLLKENSSVVGASTKRSDILQEKQIARIAKALENEEIESGRGLNQSTNLKRHGDTRWGSHYGTLLSLITLC